LSRVIRYASLEDAKILGKIHSESLKAAFKNIIPDDVLNEDFSIERRTAQRARRFYEKMGFNYDDTVQIIDMGKELRELRYIKV